MAAIWFLEAFVIFLFFFLAAGYLSRPLNTSESGFGRGKRGLGRRHPKPNGIGKKKTKTEVYVCTWGMGACVRVSEKRGMCH